MNFLIPITISILGLLCFVNGDVALLKSDPAPEGNCYMKDHDITFAIGSSVTKVRGLCNKYTCSYPQINYYGCGVAVKVGKDGKSCRVAHDLSKPYPDCCTSDQCAN